MKRSEMVDKMFEFIENIEDLRPMTREDVDLLLSGMEHVGMAPPSIPAEQVRGKDWKWGAMCTMSCICSECDPKFKMYQWDKE